MTIPATQAEVAALLGRLTGAAPLETHISAVFVPSVAAGAGRASALLPRRGMGSKAGLGFSGAGACAGA